MRMRTMGAVLSILALLAATPATLSAQTEDEIEAMRYEKCMDDAEENYAECVERASFEFMESVCFSAYGYAKLGCTIGLIL